MSAWDEYPQNYREREVQMIARATRAGDCVALLGLSGAGKSNVLGFLAQRISNSAHPMLLIDCNRLAQRSGDALLNLIRRVIDPANSTTSLDPFDALDATVAAYLTQHPRLTLLLDRFDAFGDEIASIANPLRALRDSHKFKLTYVLSMRHALKSHSELAELLYANTIWLGALSDSDARWNVLRFAARREQVWADEVAEAMIALSGRYPSLLKAIAEAYASGGELNTQALAVHPAVQLRVQEFWADQPSADEVRLCGLEAHPLLKRTHNKPEVAFDTSQLTAKEAALLAYFQANSNQLCTKDDIIRGVWPEDKAFLVGVRDDSLAQLVRRLREKIERNPASPQWIHTVPGRGYKFTPPT
ncbi:MAG: winged helix-turn-helix domain-containing protein [Anaerolineae bacterium]|nr:winged helix-turn-helix domain-containing protein [Anaerolineae bacterium]